VIMNELKNMNKKNWITYKYQGQEFSLEASEGYLVDFKNTKDWIDFLRTACGIKQKDWDKEQFNIQFKSKNQPEYIRLFYTNKEAKETDWGFEDNGEFDNSICWPPIYLHPLIEDWITFTHDCGWKQEFDVRKIKEWLKEREKNGIDNSVFILACGKCGERWQGVGKECIYRVCKDHSDDEGRQFWIEAWKKLGVGEIKEAVDEKTGEKLWKI